jgi:acyl-CoA reductase-like NAD-dependent aldehyde dehydrogenase
MRLGTVLVALAAGAQSLWAHPSTTPHVHADEIAGLVIVSLVVVGMLALAGKRGR